MKVIELGKIKIGGNNPLVLIAGPCVIEGEKLTITVAEKVKKITDKLKIPYIFKSSYDKSNRGAVDFYRGPGLKKGLAILAKIKKELHIPVVSDVHCRNEIPYAAEVLDILQIPAYLSPQTDMVVEAAKTKRIINIKKGQFLAPWDMKKICEKAKSTGNEKIFLTERGAIFGYNNLVCDMRSYSIMQELGYPVFADVTHMVRMPGPPSKDAKGGQSQFIYPLTLASVGAGCDGLFLEVHPEPAKALCDAVSMLALDKLERLLIKAKAINEIVRRK
ncbi:MAG: 3-deoxy-8-phosphooctulonate synthase [Elusimicrobia bacterium RIFOXYA2_FULL_39_19]|nr:MAG: 3-deoxy-8-phosphooctulonate synthase [Elusimicrobia bacterium RIFOXYA2_FULL_39_19]